MHVIVYASRPAHMHAIGNRTMHQGLPICMSLVRIMHLGQPIWVLLVRNINLGQPYACHWLELYI